MLPPCSHEKAWAPIDPSCAHTEVLCTNENHVRIRKWCADPKIMCESGGHGPVILEKWIWDNAIPRKARHMPSGFVHAQAWVQACWVPCWRAARALWARSARPAGPANIASTPVGRAGRACWLGVLESPLRDFEKSRGDLGKSRQVPRWRLPAPDLPPRGKNQSRF
jgi:hypothetical protein